MVRVPPFEIAGRRQRRSSTDVDYLAVFDVISHPYLILSPELIIVGANRAYLGATLTERDAIVGRHLFDAFPDNPADPTADGVRNLAASLGRVVSLRRPDAMPIQKYDIRRPSGGFEERFWDPLNTPVLVDGDRVSAIIHHVIDVTSRVRYRSPHALMAWLARCPVRVDELPGMLANAAEEIEASDKLIKHAKNLIAQQARDTERLQEMIADSQRRITRAGKINTISTTDLKAGWEIRREG